MLLAAATCPENYGQEECPTFLLGEMPNCGRASELANRIASAPSLTTGVGFIFPRPVS
jgi:hypothetical protein